eukprot:CAMPEP_0184988028 /NCGR_PEP_ID=MMETSP1098-20130426/22743_1 /TAXON_ID=89044 /ORGANISM="Spumella elongata, Strain CCAP 955/1" /LENGTH=250 /DNA_ID=CAMNT_0027512681 /DNA_START=246 /DNA_END=998 /DNA_ORIENTATION=+
MRLTADILLCAEHYINAYLDRELNLRGFKIPAIENLATLQDQFDVIDFSDNDIKKLDNFPVMNRLNALLLHNNSVSRISPTLGANLPKLSAIMLTNNRITNISEIVHVASATKLESLSLLDNPVTLKAHYRTFVIHRIPTLKWLDFRKVTQTEREESAKFFKTAAGKAFLAAVAQEVKIVETGGNVGNNSNGASGANNSVVLSEEQKVLVKRAIENAATREEIDNIERQLKAGNFEFLNDIASSDEQMAV